ncbi:hypothetical protein TGPRC2_200470 [Toxoplasma gondii TgCatPRC2]|uniref:Uncharacterized protein n=1 Tax=Toxoplasma gondii TgCatPRC2 TaxID=1130821 RepID=A0A151GZR0_TOXGO|nr:hypothetical protein TGPRC2_200470 [Toxoplasma gondii TgCatPRC2]
MRASKSSPGCSSSVFSLSSFAQSTVRLTTQSRGCHLAGGAVENEVEKLRQSLADTLARHVPENRGKRRGDGLRGDSWIAHIAVVSPGVAISVNENCDPTVRGDMVTALNLLSEKTDFPSHVVWPLLVGRSLAVPIGGAHAGLALGAWQGVYVVDGREGGGDVDLVLTLLPTLHQTQRTIQAKTRGCEDIGDDLDRFLSSVTSPYFPSGFAGEASRQRSGEYGFAEERESFLVHVWTRHTSCSLSVLGKARLIEMEPLMSRIVPEAWNDRHFQHTYEGPDDMPAHAKTTLFTAEVFLPVGAPEAEEGTRGGTGSVAGGTESASPCSTVDPLTDAVRRPTDGKNKRHFQQKCGQRVDFGPCQTATLNEHRDGGGWGGGHARKLVFSAIGVPGESGNVASCTNEKVMMVRHVVPVTTGTRPGSTAPMKALLERALQKMLAKVRIGGLHCYVRALGAGIAVSCRTEEACGGEIVSCRGTQKEMEVDGIDSGCEDGGEVVRQVLAGVIPDSWGAASKTAPAVDGGVSIVASCRGALLGNGLLIPIRAGKLVCPPEHDIFLWTGGLVGIECSSENVACEENTDGPEENKVPSTEGCSRVGSQKQRVDVTCTLLGSMSTHDHT